MYVHLSLAVALLCVQALKSTSSTGINIRLRDARQIVSTTSNTRPGFLPRASCDKLLQCIRAKVRMRTYMKAHSQTEGANTSFVAQTTLPTSNGEFIVRAYAHKDPLRQFDVIVLMNSSFEIPRGESLLYDVPVRVHDQCLTSEVFGSLRCDCQDQLMRSMKMVLNNDAVLVYMQQEGRGIGLANKLAAYALQDNGADTVQANLDLGFDDDLRSYTPVSYILRDMKIGSVELITNNPRKVNELKLLNVNISKTIPIESTPNEHNIRYLQTKASKMSHTLRPHLWEDNNGYLKYVNANETSHENVSTKCGSAECKSASKSLLESNIQRSLNRAKIQKTDLCTMGDAQSVKGRTYTHNIHKHQVAADRQKTQTETHKWIFGRESVERAIIALQNGEPIIVTDDEGRENEGDIILAAELATPQSIAETIALTSGVLCVPMERERLNELGIPPMVSKNEDPRCTAFTVSVDLRNVTTGISALERCQTIRHLSNPSAKKYDFQKPGHLFPLAAVPGGVLTRPGHTEAAVDFMKLANLQPVAVICEIKSFINKEHMARMDELKIIARERKLVLTSIEDLICYRLEKMYGVTIHLGVECDTCHS